MSFDLEMHPVAGFSMIIWKLGQEVVKDWKASMIHYSRCTRLASSGMAEHLRNCGIGIEYNCVVKWYTHVKKDSDQR
jgi:hypothetical protein